jgi:2',3'-cyclic-nucleotide 2'-phosphodiesterase (5'-nucleotidase family)
MYSTVKHILCFAVVCFFTACAPPVQEIRIEAGLIPVDSINAPGIVTEIADFILPYKQKLDAEMNETLAYSSEAIFNGTSESPLGNFIADLLLDWGCFSQKNYPIPDFALINSGGIRSPFPKGAVTLFNVYQTMPFDNTIAFVTLNKRQISELVNFIAQNQNMIISNAVISGSRQDASITIAGVQPLVEKEYILITSDYLAKGGDRMDFFASNSKVIVTDVLIRDVIKYQLKKKNKIIAPLRERRINIKD